jgi:hypothetical protein
MLPMYNKRKELLAFKERKNHLIAFLFSLIVLVFIIQPYLKPLYSQLKNSFRATSDNITKNILQKVPAKSTIFVVFPIRNNGSLNNILRYSLIPTKGVISSINFGKKSSMEMFDIYKKYDYVWFPSLSKEIFNKNKKVLKMKDKKSIFTLYKVKLDGSKIILNPIM